VGRLPSIGEEPSTGITPMARTVTPEGRKPGDSDPFQSLEGGDGGLAGLRGLDLNAPVPLG
jgi:hypothetical protein